MQVVVALTRTENGGVGYNGQYGDIDDGTNRGMKI